MQCVFNMLDLWWTTGNEGLDENLGRRHAFHLLMMMVMMI